MRSAVGILAASAAVIAGCGGSGPEETGTTGFLSLGVSDGPIHDAKKVCVTFDTIELKSGSTNTLINLNDHGGPQTINLLDFQGDQSSTIIGNIEVEAGEYQWMRLGIDAVMGGNGGSNDPGDENCADGASYMVMKDETVHNLYVPSSAQNGLKLVSGFTIPVNGSANFTAEWDLMRSITAPKGLSPDVVMKPVIRLVNNVEVGTLTGMVDSGLIVGVVNDLEEACAPSVYLFDDGVTPNPMGVDDDPESDVVDPDDAVATAIVSEQSNNDGSVTWNYTIGFLLEGSYEAAFTCFGTNFEPADGKEAIIEVNKTTTVDFEVPTPD
jgi:hypothetical protein